jgi:SAM-dependent methyltransferase
MFVVHPSARSIVNRTVRAHFGSRPVSVLEAGGGSRSRLQQAGGITISRITTIDLDPDQLRRNIYADHKILGDLQTFEFQDRYDIIEIENVIEHIENLETALKNVVRCCEPDGLLIIGAPFLHSFSGFATRITLHFFHVFYRKHMLGEPNAGKAGYDPFPTFYHPLVAPRRLKPFLSELGFDLALELYYDNKRLIRIKKNFGILSLPISWIIFMINLATPKAYDARNGDFYMIFRKRKEI